MASLPCGQILRINEIYKNISTLENQSVRTWGKVLSHDVSSQEAVFQGDDGCKLCVQTILVEPFAFQIGSCYCCIGDLVSKNNTVVLQARVMSGVLNKLNFNLFEKALELRQSYLNKTVEKD